MNVVMESYSMMNIKRLKEYDPSRFCAIRTGLGGLEYRYCMSDVSPICGKITEYAKSGKQRPFIMCEYAHAQGNSNGNFKDLLGCYL